MQHVSAQAVDAVVLELQELERTLLADQREKPTMRHEPRDIAIRQAKMLVRHILDGVAPSWPNDKRASPEIRRWLVDLKQRVDDDHADEGLAILFADLVIEDVDSIRAAQGKFRADRRSAA